jgi:hypothetical protein
MRDALLEFEGHKLILPQAAINRPDSDKLAARFVAFLES